MDSFCVCYSRLVVCYFKNNSLKQREISPLGLAGTWQDYLPLIPLGGKNAEWSSPSGEITLCLQTDQCVMLMGPILLSFLPTVRTTSVFFFISFSLSWSCGDWAKVPDWHRVYMTQNSTKAGHTGHVLSIEKTLKQQWGLQSPELPTQEIQSTHYRNPKYRKIPGYFKASSIHTQVHIYTDKLFNSYTSMYIFQGKKRRRFEGEIKQTVRKELQKDGDLHPTHTYTLLIPGFLSLFCSLYSHKKIERSVGCSWQEMFYQLIE